MISGYSTWNLGSDKYEDCNYYGATGEMCIPPL